MDSEKTERVIDDENRHQLWIGQKAARTIRADDGSIIIEKDSIITEEILKRVMMSGNLIRVLFPEDVEQYIKNRKMISKKAVRTVRADDETVIIEKNTIIGKKANLTVRSNDGTVIVKKDSIITEDIYETAQKLDKILALSMSVK